MPIPPGTKFHGVAPGVETENKGSAVRNLDRDKYTIEEFGGGGTFEYKANTPASVTMTFNSVPAVGSTVTINGVVIEFVTNNPPNPTSGNKIRVGNNASLSATNFSRFVNNDGKAAAYFITDLLPCLSVEVPDDNSSLKLIANKAGTEGNTIDCTSQTPAVTFSSDTFQGGDDETSDVLDNSGNVYIKAIACEKLSHGLPVHMVGIDPETAFPLATNKATYLNSTKRASRPGSNVVIGLAVDFTANGSFNTISNGDTFDICISGVLKDVYVYRDPVTNLYPEYGDSLCMTEDSNALQRDNGNGNSLAIMLALDDSNRGVVFVNGGLSNSSLRRTADGVSPLSTTRTPAIPPTFNSSIDGGSLVVLDPGDIEDKTPFCRCRHYTSSDSASDIFGIAAFSTFGSRTEDGTSVCTGGIVGGIYVYDASGALVSTLTTASVGLVVYAGDGTINPIHVLTTDPTSGVAVGRIQHPTIYGSNATDKWDILFEPYRIFSGGGSNP